MFMFAYVNIMKFFFHICFACFMFLFVVLLFLFLNHIILSCSLLEIRLGPFLYPLFLWLFVFLIVWIDSTRSMSIFTSINHLRVRFLLELNVDYLFFSKEKFSRNCRLLTKVVDYPPLVGVIFHNVHNHVYIHGRSPYYP